MKRIFAFCVVATFAMWLTPLVHAQQSTQATQVNPGTQVRLQLVDSLNTTVAHNGDTFTAIVTEPVFSGNTLLLPAGSKIHGTITEVSRPKLFSMFRGGASMNLVFNSVEVQSRIFPARMSILQIYNGGIDTGKQRKDLRTIEGEVVEEHQGVATDVEDVAIGTAGGSTVGLIFSHVLRGTVIGLVGGSAYVVAKKGKDVELPAQTGMLVRMDSTLSLPSSLLHSVSYQSGGF
jgi:hypothetical protein